MAGIPLGETCVMCPRRGSTRCGRCSDAKYCSLDCQTLDWRNHKIICRRFQGPRPGPANRRAILFPGGDQNPRIHWIEAQPGYNITYLLIGEQLPAESMHHICTRNSIQQRNIKRDESDNLDIQRLGNPNLPFNDAVRRSTRGGTCGSDWRGPILVTRTSGVEAAFDEYRDVDMRDFRNAADYFSFGYRGDNNGNVHTLANVLACENLVARGIPQYGERAVSGADIVFAQQGSGIANLLGIPLQIRPAAQFDDRATGRAGQNAYARLLKADINSVTVGSQMTPEQHEERRQLYADLGRDAAARFELRRVDDGVQGFGSPHEHYCEANVGAVVIVRADGIPLLRNHVEALCEYIQQEVAPLIEAATRGLNPGDTVEEREHILNQITRANFLDFWNRYVAQRAANFEWAVAPSPYHMVDPVLQGYRDAAEQLFQEQDA